MSVKALWRATTTPGFLGRLSGQRGGRAALILTGFFVAPVVVVSLIWLVGLAPIFFGVHWIPAVLASAFGFVYCMWLGLAFGWWGTGTVAHERGGGDQFGDFPSGVAFGLGGLRLLLQLLGIGGCFIVVVLIWVDLRWWHLTSSPEVDGLPDKAATMPVPEDWILTNASRGNTLPTATPADHYDYLMSFDVPESTTFSGVERWLSSPQWEDSFGALQEIDCDAEFERCEAQVAPRDGTEVRYVVKVSGPDESSVASLPPSVRVELEYWAPAPGA